MKEAGFKEKLDFYISRLESNQEWYSLNFLTTGDPGITNEVIHDCAAKYYENIEIRHLYNKLTDILELRIVECVNSGSLDKEIAKMMLRSFHKWDSKVVQESETYIMDISIVYPDQQATPNKKAKPTKDK